ncbi:hypothetical protein [Neomesorhizobium albiziae]|uniref:hypothetical protein n=1 Tax=Neomesorhizobium albiziae TaxID=335020 RepID=UPI001FCE5483|nr:hypothetical protein [Mesorhizobium albiziae]
MIEKAIRAALEKGDAEDKGFREKVYRSAFAALDRALQANPNVTVETAISRRKSLQAKITEIESEFIPAVPEIDPAIFDFSENGSAQQPAELEVRPAPAAPVAPVVTAPRVEPTSPAAPVVEPMAPAAPVASAAPAVSVVETVAPTIDTAATQAESPAPRIDVSPPSPSAVAPAIDLGIAGNAPPARPAAANGRTEPSFASEPSIGGPATVTPPEDPTAFTAPDVAALQMDPPKQPVSEEEIYEVSPDPDAAVARERRRPYSAMFIAVTLLVAGAMGLWWAADTGLLKSAAERDTSVPNPPATADAEDFIPEDQEPVQAPRKPGETDALKNWISVFTPADANNVSAPSDTGVEVVQGDEGEVLRIRSGTSGSAILFDVGQGVLEQIAGKRAIFDIVASAEEGQETQISVSCNFGELGDCGRKRYAVGHERGEFLFEIELPAGEPGAGGTIAISSDISNEGKAVDISEIKVSIGE